MPRDFLAHIKAIFRLLVRRNSEDSTLYFGVRRTSQLIRIGPDERAILDADGYNDVSAIDVALLDDLYGKSLGHLDIGIRDGKNLPAYRRLRAHHLAEYGNVFTVTQWGTERIERLDLQKMSQGLPLRVTEKGEKLLKMIGRR